LESG
jgi:tubulin polyglutamylase TTLL6/13